MSTAKVPGIPQRYLDLFGTSEEREAEVSERRRRRSERRAARHSKPDK